MVSHDNVFFECIMDRWNEGMKTVQCKLHYIYQIDGEKERKLFKIIVAALVQNHSSLLHCYELY